MTNKVSGWNVVTDPAIIELRKKIVRALNASVGPVSGKTHPSLERQLDTLLAEYTDGLLDAERKRYQTFKVGYHDVDQLYKDDSDKVADIQAKAKCSSCGGTGLVCGIVCLDCSGTGRNT